MKNKEKDFEFHKELLKIVKTKGILVKKISFTDDFLCDAVRKEYKKCLGATFVWNFVHTEITHVYQIYEDFDGSIKYYDYPQITEKIARQLRKKVR